MSKVIKGIVSNISEKQWEDRRSGEDIILYSFQLEDSNRWYRTGTYNPSEMGIRRGQAVSFMADTKGNVSEESVEKIEASEVERAPKANKSFGGKGGGSSWKGNAEKDTYWKDKEQRDIERDKRYQEVDIPRMTFCTSQDAAVALATAALQHDVLSFGNASKAAKLGLLLDYVDTLTERFFKQRMAADVAGAGETSAPKKKKAAKQAPDEDYEDNDWSEEEE